MKRIKNTYLGISPGTKYIGFAVMKDNELLDWFVKTFPNKWSNSKLNLICKTIQSIIANSKANAIALKTPPAFQISQALSQIFESVYDLAKTNKISINSYPIAKIKSRWMSKNKNVLIQEFLIRYPELEHEFNSCTCKYYMKIFEALGAVLMKIERTS